ncbi:MAG: acetyltransferase-like isoleucine patch superfamily enzyme [Zhongshania sp.]|jgi:acetyltransferase-like isoleucine patch superfamily enzyme
MAVGKVLSELRLYSCNFWVNRIPSHILRLKFYSMVMGFKIGQGSSILMDCSFDSKGGFLLGGGSVISARCRIDTRGGVIIGSGVSVSSDVAILTADHDMDDPYFTGRNRSVVIGDNVWIGTRATILPGVKIGDGAVIAAGALVTKNVEPHHVVAGVPAQFVRKRADTSPYRLNYRRLFQ